MSDTIEAHHSAPVTKAGNRALSAALFLVLAVGLFAAAFVYVGGADYVGGLLGGGPSAPATTPAAVAPKPVAKPAEVSDALAKRMYIEQIESAASIKRLADGTCTGFTIDKVEEKSASEKWVAITAKFATAPNTMKGVMAFSLQGGKWYFLWIQDLSSVDVATPEGLLGSPKLTEPTEPTDEEYTEAGIKTVDNAVIAAILSSQAENQALVKGILDGDWTTIVLAKPETGQGTITVPVTATGTGGEVKGSVTLLTKQIDGKDRTFVASFKRQ